MDDCANVVGHQNIGHLAVEVLELRGYKYTEGSDAMFPRPEADSVAAVESRDPTQYPEPSMHPCDLDHCTEILTRSLGRYGATRV